MEPIVYLRGYITADNIRNKSDEDIPVYSVTHDNGFCTSYFDKDVTGDDKSTYKVVPRGYFAYNPLRVNVGSIGYQNVQDKVLVSSRYVVFKLTTEEIVPEYLEILLKSDIYLQIINGLCRGSVRPELTIHLLGKAPVRIYSPDIQRKLVQDIHLIDALIQKCNHTIDLFDELIKSRFIEMFGTSTNPKYGQVRIADLVSKDIEKVPKKYNPEDVIDYIDISSIDKESRSIVETTEYAVKDAPSRAQQCVIEGDILLSNVRPNLKTLAIVNSNKDNLVCSTGFTVLRCTDSCPEYLMMAITDDYFTNKLVKKANGSSYPAVTSKDVYNSAIPSASIELQNQFAAFVQLVDKSKCKMVQQRNNLIQLSKSIQQKYFSPKSKEGARNG